MNTEQEDPKKVFGPLHRLSVSRCRQLLLLQHEPRYALLLSSLLLSQEEAGYASYD